MSMVMKIHEHGKIAIAILAIILLANCINCYASYASDIHVNRVYTDKARYNPGDTVTISVDLSNTGIGDWSGTLNLLITHLETVVYSSSKAVSINSGQDITTTFSWVTPIIDHQGYLIKVYTNTGDYQTGAVDVSSDWTKYPRYGYIQDFGDITQNTIDTQINALTQDFYINSFQFYDWMWRHEVPIPRSDGINIDASWEDLFGRRIVWNTVQSYISAIHSKNAKAMAYMMSYAAWEGYDNYGVSPTWGVFWDTNHASQLNVDFGNGKYLWLFAPTNANWQNYIGNAYVECINAGGFDGIQMDQMGQRDNVYDYFGNRYDLQNSFSSLINAIKTRLVNNNPSRSYVDFNIVDGAVNGWAVNDVSSNANTDFNYSEIWWKANNYNDIRNYIEQVRSKSGKKALVLAAYMNYNENTGDRYEAENAVYYGVDVESNHPGYSGTGFLQNFAHEGDYVQFDINVSESRYYALVFQYGNRSDHATRSIYVDGSKIGVVGFHPQGTWDAFVHDAYINVFLTAGNHTIRVVYDRGDTGAINLDCMTLGEFNEASVRLANAAFAASGATHIELGAGLDDVTMLPHEYYPNTSKVMSESLKTSMKEHYKFITAYENLLFDSNINYSDQGNQYISIANQPISGDGSPGTIWHITRMTVDYDILHLINLKNENDARWRNWTNTPVKQSNLAVKYYMSPEADVTGVYVASPDYDHGITHSLNYTTGTDSVGFYVSFTVPSLEYWDMIYIKRTIPVPKDNRYEAEDAIKTNVSTNNNHAGYTGSGFVDGFAEQGDEVTFQVNISTAGNHTLTFRYANDTGYTSTRQIYVDGVHAGTLYMPDLANWDTWSTASVNTYLTPGIHTVCIYYDNSCAHAINLDNLTVY